MRPERTDQREFIVRRDAGVDEEVGDDSCVAVQKIIFLQIPICYNAPLSFVSDRKGLFQCPQSPSRTTTSPSSPGHSIATRLKVLIRRECALRPRAAIGASLTKFENKNLTVFRLGAVRFVPGEPLDHSNFKLYICHAACLRLRRQQRGAGALAPTPTSL